MTFNDNSLLQYFKLPEKNYKRLPPKANISIGHFQKYHNTLCLPSKILHKHCFHFPLGLTMVPRENKNNSYVKFWRTNKEYYGIFESGLWRLSDQKYLPQPCAAKTLKMRLGTDLPQDILLLRIPPLPFVEKRKLGNDVDRKIINSIPELSLSK